MVPEQTRKDLYAAADYLEQNGWCQDTFFTKSGQACLTGALYAVTDSLQKPNGVAPNEFLPLRSSPSRYIEAQYYVSRYLHPEKPTYWNIEGALFIWNDKDYRTAEDVVTALRGAADQ